jgi:hypothetical protein
MAPTSTPVPVTDGEFLVALRAAIDRYFAAVDQWEAAYFRYYRMPDAAQRSGDLTEEQRAFENERRALELLLPRARVLCFRYGQSDVFGGLTWAALGHHTPQHRTDSAISRGERGAVMACLIELSVACREPDPKQPPVPIPERPLLDRILGLFF